MLITTAPDCYSSKRLIEEFLKLYGKKVIVINPKKFSSSEWINLSQKKIGPILIRSTGIDYDDSDLYFADFLQSKNQTFIQSINEQKIFRDKLQQFLYFEQHNISTPHTIYFKGNNYPTPQWENEKYIIKTRRGMKGLGVTYLEGNQSLLSLLQTLWSINDQNFLIQPFVAGIEYRYFVCDGEIQYILKKDKNGITGNANSDTHFSLVSIKDAPTKEIDKICNLIHSHYYAVDLILDQQQREYVLECNLAPGFEQLEQLSGDNIAKKIWDYKVVKK